LAREKRTKGQEEVMSSALNTTIVKRNACLLFASVMYFAGSQDCVANLPFERQCKLVAVVPKVKIAELLCK
jgi:hypothetical protein